SPRAASSRDPFINRHLSRAARTHAAAVAITLALFPREDAHRARAVGRDGPHAPQTFHRLGGPPAKHLVENPASVAWSTHFCVPRRHSCRRIVMTRTGVEMSLDAARKSACATVQ